MHREIDRIGIVLTLGSAGINSEQAANAADALAKIETGQFAAVVLDCELPMTDIFECTKAIRMNETNTHKRLPIIAMSIWDGLRHTCLAADMDAFLDKASSAELLKQTICHYTGSALDSGEASYSGF